MTYTNYNSQYIRIENLKTLIATSSLDHFYKEVFSKDSEYIESVYKIQELIRLIPSEIKNTKEFKDNFGPAFVRILEEKISVKQINYFKIKDAYFLI